MARRHPILRVFLILAVSAVGLLVLVAGLAVFGGLDERALFGNAVGVVDVRGVIEDGTDVIETLERFRRQDGTVAVVLRIDSPGGAVAPSQEIYDEVWRVREQKPVVASLGNVAASGGYYIASAANEIVADPGTITGSIGAIMSVPYYAPLADKIGFSEETVKSGRFKDTGHPLRKLSPDERTLLQNMVDDVLGQFVEAVARGRNMPAARVRTLADGRIYSGTQAVASGLVDRLGGLESAIRLAWQKAKQVGEPRVVRVRPHRLPWIFQLLGSTLADAPQSHGGLFFLYRGPLPY
ncbi:MAG TPA: signal peptide peptidase SppA [Polyangiaceae bacterium]|jgi:protease-4|nr:signal peptide peptidase SppA [Polyangiaceae bacterium]